MTFGRNDWFIKVPGYCVSLMELRVGSAPGRLPFTKHNFFYGVCCVKPCQRLGEWLLHKGNGAAMKSNIRTRPTSYWDVITPSCFQQCICGLDTEPWKPSFLEKKIEPRAHLGFSLPGMNKRRSSRSISPWASLKVSAADGRCEKRRSCINNSLVSFGGCWNINKRACRYIISQQRRQQQWRCGGVSGGCVLESHYKSHNTEPQPHKQAWLVPRATWQ